MKFSSRFALGSASTLYAAGTTSALVSHCVGGDSVCFQWGVPQVASQSGSGNVYFQLSASDSLRWAGLGIGRGMVGAEVFMIYQDGNNNVTLSPRQSPREAEPIYSQRDVELLEGSGIVNGRMVANVRCGDCSRLDLSGSNDWIAAWQSGNAVDSTDPDARLTEHDGHAQFSVNMAQALINSDLNPFAGSGAVNEDSDGGSDGDGDSGSSSGVTESAPTNTNTILLAHGIIMSIVFVVGYPVGAMLMPLIARWLIHASWQFIVFLAMWAAFGLGYIVAQRDNEFFTQTHTRLGVFVVALLGIQPILGWLHHVHYQKHQGRGIVSYVHIWYGRILIVLGIVNGGLGLDLSGASRSYKIAYGVVAGVIGLIWLLAIAFRAFRKRRASSVGSSVRKPSEGQLEMS